MRMCKYNNNVGCNLRGNSDCGHCEIKKVYDQGRADVIDDCQKILLNPCDCERDCVVEDRTDCVNCMAKRMDQLKEKNND